MNKKIAHSMKKKTMMENISLSEALNNTFLSLIILSPLNMCPIIKRKEEDEDD
jgi:hypothetical protein